MTITAQTSSASPVLANRLAKLQPFYVMEILRQASALEASGRDIIHLEIGEPDFPCPEPMLHAANAFLTRGSVRYTPACGIPALRQRIAEYYRKRYGLTITVPRIILTGGASAALGLAVAAITSTGARWLLTDPSYPSNRHIIQTFDGVASTIAVGPEDNFQLQPKHLAAHWDESVCGVMLASPSNPTGSVIGATELAAVQQFVSARQAHLLVDEIYQGLQYTGHDHCALATDDNIWVVNSFSKYFGMTGWRLGWLVVPEAFAERLESLAQHMYICPSAPAQYAAMAAFDDSTLMLLEQRKAEFAKRRECLLGNLRALDFGIHYEASGAFYVYADVNKFTDNSLEFCQRMLAEAGVAMTPGLDFGSHQANHYVRLAYTCSEARLDEACERLRRCL